MDPKISVNSVIDIKYHVINHFNGISPSSTDQTVRGLIPRQRIRSTTQILMPPLYRSLKELYSFIGDSSMSFSDMYPGLRRYTILRIK